MLNVFGLKFYYQRSNNLNSTLTFTKESPVVESIPGNGFRKIKHVAHIASYYGACVLFLYSQVKVREFKKFASYHFPLINNRNFSVLVNIFSFKNNLFSPLERSFER